MNPTMGRTEWLLLIGLSVLWGGSFFFIGVAVDGLSPFTIVALRVSIAAFALFVILQLLGIRIPHSRQLWAAFFVMGLVNNAIPFSLIFWGQTQIESGLASILNGTTAVFGAVVAGLLLKDEPLTPRKFLGALFGLAGVAAIMGFDALKGLDPRNLAQIAVLVELQRSFVGKRLVRVGSVHRGAILQEADPENCMSLAHSARYLSAIKTAAALSISSFEMRPRVPAWRALLRTRSASTEV